MKTSSIPQRVVGRLLEDGENDLHDEIDQIPADPIRITLHSSHGDITFDGMGRVVENNLHVGDGDDDMRPDDVPVQLDIEEFRRTYPTFPIEGDHDILDWGFWMANGEYAPPEEDWRRDWHSREIRAAAFPEYGIHDPEAEKAARERYDDGMI